MTDPDRAPQPIEEAANLAADQIRRVWQLAFVHGVREGMEVAAKICEAVAVTTRCKPDGVSEGDVAMVACAEFLRDKIREVTLTIEDPPPVAECNTPTKEEE